MTDADLAAYRDDHGQGYLEKAADWVGDNWEYIAAGAAVAVGVGLMFTGVGGPVGLALIGAASGTLIGGGVSIASQKYTTGQVNWGTVARDAAIGGATGALGGAAFGTAAKTSQLYASSARVGASRAVSQIEGSSTALAQQLGRQGEVAAGIVKNTQRIPSVTGTASYRIPDVLDDAGRAIGEVKNVSKLSYTNQLRGFAAYGQQHGYQFTLWTRPTTELSSPLQTAIRNKEIILRTLQ